MRPRAQFVFHTSNIPIYGESARIKVTDIPSGALVIYRVFLLPGRLGNEITMYAVGEFNPEVAPGIRYQIRKEEITQSKVRKRINVLS